MDLDVLASGLKFPEGPVAMDDGSVILVEIARGTLTRVDADGTVDVVADCGGGPNGAAVGPDGAMYVCNNGGFRWSEMGDWLLPMDLLTGANEAPGFDGGEPGEARQDKEHRRQHGATPSQPAGAGGRRASQHRRLMHVRSPGGNAARRVCGVASRRARRPALSPARGRC